MKEQIYFFDNGATTKVDERVLEAMLPYFTEYYGNPNSIHRYGRKAKAAVEMSRESIAERLHISPSSLFFCGTGSEANNLAILGLATTGQIKHVISGKTEHASVLNTILSLEKIGIEVSIINPDSNGRIDAAAIRETLRPDTGLVSIMGVNNETGVMNDIGEIGEILPEGVVFHSDLVQALAKTTTPLDQWRVDLASFAAHKIHGPKGIGAMYIRPGINLNKILFGASQEFDRRPGTENTSAIVGFAEAVKLYTDPLHVLEIRDKFEELIKSKIPGVIFNGANAPRAPHVSNVRFPKISGDSLLINLDRRGVLASLGSACSSGSINPSRVLMAMGLSASEALSSIRFSFGRFNQIDELDPATDIIAQEVNRLRR